MRQQYFSKPKKSFQTARGFSIPSQIPILMAVKPLLWGKEITLSSDAPLLAASASRHLLGAALLYGNVLATCSFLFKVKDTIFFAKDINYLNHSLTWLDSLFIDLECLLITPKQSSNLLSLFEEIRVRFCIALQPWIRGHRGEISISLCYEETEETGGDHVFIRHPFPDPLTRLSRYVTSNKQS